MNPKLRALLAAIGIVVISGTSYLLVTIRPGVTRADLVDAGITSDCDPVEVICQVRQIATPFCRPAAPKYLTVRSLAYQCARGGNLDPVLIMRWPRTPINTECFEAVGEASGSTGLPSACVVASATFDDGGSLAAALDVDRCACRQRGQLCRWTQRDGGLTPMNFAQTYRVDQAPFVGVGCARTVCTEKAGDEGQSMPASCL